MSFEVGTPRIFEVRMTNGVLLYEPSSTSFSPTLSPRTACGALYDIYRRAGEIKRLIREIDKVAKVREQNLNDRVARRELDGILEHQEALLRHYVLDSLYTPDGNITWFFNGQASTAFDGRRAFNRCLSAIAREVYPANLIAVA